MESITRNALRLAITSCRRLLEEDYFLQLEGQYGIRGDGMMEPLDGMTHLDATGFAERRAIEAALQHDQLQEQDISQALARFVRESAFTALNRFAALKLMENPVRALIMESVGRKTQSKGFRQFILISPEALRDKPDSGYQLYLELLISSLSKTLGALFDRSLPQSILFPSQACLNQVLDLLNQPELEEVWSEDETVGWIYQYFTPPELRDQVRKESATPRNSNELAFRNQFYTPRYVVEFLTDNTLGRLWTQIRKGETLLKDQCQYLIWPEQAENETDVDDLQKDPRQIRILDPACGSGHFLLYAFDLLETIYQEAYQDIDFGSPLRNDYPDPDEFRRALPALILAHNVHGIDIDLRAVQIASLALWLRAHRAYSEMNIPPRKRTALLKPQIVCAEPMPGEYDLLGEYLRELKPAVIGNLIREIWDSMKGANELGSLLKIEIEIRAAISKARQAWQTMPEGVQLGLFGEKTDAMQLKLDLAEIRDETFWERAEEEALRELERYARSTSDTLQTTRRLFSHDAIQGFAFVNLLLQPFDVVLMNPPFGASSLGSKEYIKKNYPRTKNDLYATFVERGLELLNPGGYLGAITSRTGFFLKSFQKWREEILLKEAQVISMADLGYGVLDTAMVETAAYVIQKNLE
jgi:hypothetical protein